MDDVVVRVKGLRELQVAMRHTERDSRLFVRKEFRTVAEPVRRTSEKLTESKIRRMPYSPRWAKMRVGVTQKLVYVAPRMRGVKRKGNASARRPNLANLIMERAMEPALHEHEREIVHRLEGAFDHIADRFNRGGAL